MAGKKGMKGGGGARPGAGRKPRKLPAEASNQAAMIVEPIAPDLPAGADLLAFLQAVALGRVKTTPLQVRAAIAAVQYTHTKRHDGGKKEDVADKAKKAASRFRAAPLPLKLVRNGD